MAIKELCGIDTENSTYASEFEVLADKIYSRAFAGEGKLYTSLTYLLGDLQDYQMKPTQAHQTIRPSQQKILQIFNSSEGTFIIPVNVLPVSQCTLSHSIRNVSWLK
jgi:hypothetical protein